MLPNKSIRAQRYYKAAFVVTYLDTIRIAAIKDSMACKIVVVGQDCWRDRISFDMQHGANHICSWGGRRADPTIMCMSQVQNGWVLCTRWNIGRWSLYDNSCLAFMCNEDVDLIIHHDNISGRCPMNFAAMRMPLFWRMRRRWSCGNSECNWNPLMFIPPAADSRRVPCSSFLSSIVSNVQLPPPCAMSIGIWSHPEDLSERLSQATTFLTEARYIACYSWCQLCFCICYYQIWAPCTLLMTWQWMLYREYMAARTERWGEGGISKIVSPSPSLLGCAVSDGTPTFAMFCIMVNLANEWRTRSGQRCGWWCCAICATFWTICYFAPENVRLGMHFRVRSAEGGLVMHDSCVVASFTWQVP